MKTILTWFFLSVLFGLIISGCGAESSEPLETEEETMTFDLTSPAFAPGEPIPTKYTCDDQDISPPLKWSDPPGGTQSFALIMDDPDAPVGIWVHWVLFNLSPDTRDLPEQAASPAGAQDGQNSWKRTGYGGPCPPSGAHRYFFKLYALDTTLNLPAGATKAQVLKAMEGHILAQAEVMGVYSRQ
jgi:Raf kinase inhibitor-like YbhB/YbcL family protein